MDHMTGRQLRNLRIAKGLSTEKAAGMVGVGRRTWVRYETLPKVPAPIAKLVALLWKEVR